MSINAFEGARRIALLCGGLWVAGCLAYAVFSTPYVSLTYAIPAFGARPEPAEDCRSSRDASKYTSVETPAKDSVSVTFCFIADRADSGSYLIPFRYVVSPDNPDAARVYAARKEALRKGAAADAERLTEYLLSMPVGSADTRTVWMASEHDSEVRRYMDEVAAGFKFGPSDLERLQKVRREKRWEQWKEALQVLFGGIAFWWALVTATGWIARGFMGIPRGADRRPAQ